MPADAEELAATEDGATVVAEADADETTGTAGAVAELALEAETEAGTEADWRSWMVSRRSCFFWAFWALVALGCCFWGRCGRLKGMAGTNGFLASPLGGLLAPDGGAMLAHGED